MVIGNESITATHGSKTQKHEFPLWIFSLIAIAIMTGGALLGLMAESLMNPENLFSNLSFVKRVLWFTCLQAFLSTALSIIPAIPVARAFSRHPAFPGRNLILQLFSVPLALPALVAVLGILSIAGTNGILAQMLSQVSDFKWPGIYGLQGILIGHVFFNMPLAVRFFLEALNTIPKGHWRLAYQLGMKTGTVFRLIEWPALRGALPGIASLIFVLCLTSFTIALILGGGPAGTTLEVFIYQALRFDFNPGRAVLFTFLQVIIALIPILCIQIPVKKMIAAKNPTVSQEKPQKPKTLETSINFTLISFSALLIGAPLCAIAFQGLMTSDLPRLIKEPEVQQAAARSLVFSVVSGFLSLALILPLAIHQKKSAAFERLGEILSCLLLALPPTVIAAGWFIMLYRYTNILALAPVMIICINSLMTFPFIIGILRPAYLQTCAHNERLASQLGIRGYHRWRLIIWPCLRRPILASFMFALAISFGDLGIAAIFGSERIQTLPLLLLSRMGNYRTADATGITLILGFFCLTCIMVIQKIAQKG